MLLLLGVGLVGATYGLSHLLANMVDLGKWVQRVDGEVCNEISNRIGVHNMDQYRSQLTGLRKS